MNIMIDSLGGWRVETNKLGETDLRNIQSLYKRLSVHEKLVTEKFQMSKYNLHDLYIFTKRKDPEVIEQNMKKIKNQYLSFLIIGEILTISNHSFKYLPKILEHLVNNITDRQLLELLLSYTNECHATYSNITRLNSISKLLNRSFLVKEYTEKRENTLSNSFHYIMEN